MTTKIKLVNGHLSFVSGKPQLNILHQATGSRAPGATRVARRPTHWLGYTGETHPRGLKTFDFLLVHGGGH
ncbi:hypothetical protein [Nostoc sp.]